MVVMKELENGALRLMKCGVAFVGDKKYANTVSSK
jgi:hypothetical protein